MENFYINLSVVEPYVTYLRSYSISLVDFIKVRETRFNEIRYIFDDANVDKFLKAISDVDNDIKKLVITIEEYAQVMKKEADAYRRYLG